MPRHPLQLEMKKYGRLIPIGQHNGTKNKSLRWSFQCDCGAILICSPHSVKSGRTKSCGCFRTEILKARKTHGETSAGKFSPEYRSYASMLQRCYNKNHDQFHDYGGRGITVCEAWRLNFSQFLADMGRRPSLQYSLERKSNDCGYTPDNCIWATRHQQNVNTRRAKPVLRSDGELFQSLWHAAQSVAGDSSNICAACKGRIKSAYGFKWSFVEQLGQAAKEAA